mmetsp:Transcript_67414/g.200443  ORF Transcript_67414/g.200443 Transcript_67414/m.200443 type:complete len:328 (+) Transcript_67414:442-1425(+)
MDVLVLRDFALQDGDAFLQFLVVYLVQPRQDVELLQSVRLQALSQLGQPPGASGHQLPPALIVRDLFRHNIDPQLLDPVHQRRQQLGRLHQLLRDSIMSCLLRLKILLQSQHWPDRLPQFPDPQEVLCRNVGPVFVEQAAGERPAVFLQEADLNGECLQVASVKPALQEQELDLVAQRELGGITVLLVLSSQPLLLLLLDNLYEAMETVEEVLLLVAAENAVSQQLPGFVLHQSLRPDQSMQEIVVHGLQLVLPLKAIVASDGHPVEPRHRLLGSHGRLLPHHEALLQEGACLREGVLELDDLVLEHRNLRVGPVEFQLQGREHLLR